MEITLKPGAWYDGSFNGEHVSIHNNNGHDIIYDCNTNSIKTESNHELIATTAPLWPEARIEYCKSYAEGGVVRNPYYNVDTNDYNDREVRAADTLFNSADFTAITSATSADATRWNTAGANPYDSILDYMDRQIKEAFKPFIKPINEAVKAFNELSKVLEPESKFKIGDKVKVITSDPYCFTHGGAKEFISIKGMEGIVKSKIMNDYSVDIHGYEFHLIDSELEPVFDCIQAKKEFMDLSCDYDSFQDEQKPFIPLIIKWER